jgi:hypothetical protein
VRNGITVADVRWIWQRIGKISDDQIRAALEASGADPGEVSCYAAAIRDRLNRLKAVAEAR